MIPPLRAQISWKQGGGHLVVGEKTQIFRTRSWLVFPLETAKIVIFSRACGAKIIVLPLEKTFSMHFRRAAGEFFWQFDDRFPFRNSHFGLTKSRFFLAAGGGPKFGSEIRASKTRGGDHLVDPPHLVTIQLIPHSKLSHFLVQNAFQIFSARETFQNSATRVATPCHRWGPGRKRRFSLSAPLHVSV